MTDEPLTGSSPGKRSSTDEPLTEHDVAERLDRAVMRVVRIMMDVRQLGPDMVDLVKRSRYTTNALLLLADELDEWSIRSTRQREAGGISVDEFLARPLTGSALDPDDEEDGRV